MPEIDVTEVLIDPVVAATRFVVVRRRSRTDNSGFEISSEVRIPKVRGSITPEGDNSLNRQDSFQTQNKTLMVVTKFFLRAAAETANGWQWQPDLVFWQNDYFIVTSVEDFSQFGAGMIVAKAESFDYVGSPPLGNPASRGVLDFRLINQSAYLGVV